MLASAAQYERHLIGRRTRDALAAPEAAGVRLSRPSVFPTYIVARIVAERRSSASIRAIAERLTASRQEGAVLPWA